MLYPLITNNAASALKNGVTASLTGPVERGDIQTLKRHLESMPLEHKLAYTDLSKELVAIAEEKNSEIDYSEIKNFLGGF